jgi:hypothetical protein
MLRQAVCVGINDYPGQDADLGGCVNDAKDWSAAVRQAAPHAKVQVLLDGQATRMGILNALSALITGLGAGDLGVFTYSGHGTWVPDTNGDESDGRDEALCPVDLTPQSLIIDDELNMMFSQLAAGARLLFVSDSCHSGTVARFAGLPRQKRPVRFLPPAMIQHEPSLQRLVEAPERSKPRRRRAFPGVVHLAACRDNEYAYDAEFGGRPNGAFTYAALQALKSTTPPTTYAHWIAEIRKQLPTWQHPQTPSLDAAVGLRNLAVWS